jgi:hypothetical protein
MNNKQQAIQQIEDFLQSDENGMLEIIGGLE